MDCTTISEDLIMIAGQNKIGFVIAILFVLSTMWFAGCLFYVAYSKLKEMKK